MEHLVPLFLGELFQISTHHRVAFGPLEGGHAVQIVQALGPVRLVLLHTVGLARAAYTAALTGHNLYQVKIGIARLNFFQQLLGIGQTVDDSQVDIPVTRIDLLSRRGEYFSSRSTFLDLSGRQKRTTASATPPVVP